ncbi:helicase [Verrucomicrobiaceae bacterium N1E253]|uniref:Helicase n=1 Tax=Oceaniferula marina TaxID=2748318 RepID=A0A851GBI6_9BACT|nr:helicase-related protein [Oceaniferula marina]NWK54973.1 helicase [Oceaniferula marina]
MSVVSKKEHHHLNNRAKLLAALAGEIFGPDSPFDLGKESLLVESTPYDVGERIEFDDWKAYHATRPVDKITGEEILKDEKPSSRYGLGILFPQTDQEIGNDSEVHAVEEAVSVGKKEFSENEDESYEAGNQIGKREVKLAKNMEKRAKLSGEALSEGSQDDSDSDSDSSDLRLANQRKQRSIGLSFVVDSGVGGNISINVTGGRYKRSGNVRIKGKTTNQNWWVRHPVKHEISIPLHQFKNVEAPVEPVPIDVPVLPGLPPLKLQMEFLVRGRERIPGTEHPDTARLITLSLVNRTECRKDLAEEHSFFQARFEVVSQDSDQAILHYPSSKIVNAGEEQESLDLLYRHERTFSTGHGCAGTWKADEKAFHAKKVIAEALPSHESPSITPILTYKDSSTGKLEELRIPLTTLADENRTEEALGHLRQLVSLYENWINEKKEEIVDLEEKYKAAASRHIEDCLEAMNRMQRGVRLLEADPDSEASIAFRLTNKSMLMQALASRARTRIRIRDEKIQRNIYEPEYVAPDLTSKEAIDRSWRPFQIAFLLMNLTSLADPSDPGREIVDLIWFPTGGGKTEAYLGCAAFSIFMRRLRNPADVGTDVLMRYTLRLLTAQQFQRASSLICAMEIIRKNLAERLGTTPFTIGIWVGSSTTPNSRDGAVTSIAQTRRNGAEDYKMVLLKCPWCGAEIGPRKTQGRGNSYDVSGIRRGNGTVIVHCPDRKCDFARALPISVIDQDLYDEPPTFVIATVDKFASLAWKSNCRSLFGIDSEGTRRVSPPGLIIQDELHLITGPLGSMVGLYETLVDALATDDRNLGQPVKPKLIAATATTRASESQIKDLYARPQTSIFPPPGVDASDSFFARYSRDEKGKRRPGRLYVGLLPLNYSSLLTASVRTYAALIAAAQGFPNDDDRDPWWSLLIFYNSLRELGGGLTLFGSDIPERLKNIQRRWFPNQKHRYIYEILELTGRLSNSEVPQALESLSRAYTSKPARGHYPVDCCLASNIIEVGVDVDRLALMAVAGQPKTTAQYIQATGRVGRNLQGLILTHYNATKARDRSHYEQFQSYHSRLYAQVEPASVTPFTIPVMERALHAIMIAWVRQTLPLDELSAPWPFDGTPLELAADRAYDLLKQRVKVLCTNPKEQKRVLSDLDDCYRKRRKEWEKFGSVRWQEYFPKENSGDQPLILPPGSPYPIGWVNKVWPTPNSLRGVDSECQPIIPSYADASDTESETKTISEL